MDEECGDTKKSSSGGGWLSRLSLSFSAPSSQSEYEQSSISRVTQLLTPSALHKFLSNNSTSSQQTEQHLHSIKENGYIGEEEIHSQCASNTNVQTATSDLWRSGVPTLSTDQRAQRNPVNSSEQIRNLEEFVLKFDTDREQQTIPFRKSGLNKERRKTLQITTRTSQETNDQTNRKHIGVDINPSFSAAPFERKRRVEEERNDEFKPMTKRSRISEVTFNNRPYNRQNACRAKGGVCLGYRSIFQERVLFTSQSAIEANRRSISLLDDRSGRSSSLRSRIGSLTNRPGTGALSSQTKRILDQLEKISTPVKDAWKLPVSNPWQPERWQHKSATGDDSSSKLKGPPLNSIRTPTRAQILSQSRTLGSIGSKPYWPKPGRRQEDITKNSSTASELIDTSPNTKQSSVLKTVGGRRSNTFSAKIPSLVDNHDGQLQVDSIEPVALPLSSERVPKAGFVVAQSSESSDHTQPAFSFSIPRRFVDSSFSNPSANKSNESVVCDDNSKENQSHESSISESTDSDENDEKPTSSLAQISVTTLEQFKHSEKWKCPFCHSNNPVSQSRCNQCSHKKSDVEQKEIASGSVKTNENWKCQKCKLENTSDKKLCICCQTQKDWNLDAEEVEKPKTKWSCSECFVENKIETEACVCCGSKREGVTVVGPNTSTSGSAVIKSSKWNCDECFVENNADASICVCCSSRKGGNKGQETKIIDIFNQQSKETEKPWSCTTCFISNSPEKQACISCSTTKPGNTYKPVQFGFGVTNAFSKASSSQPSTATSAPLFGLTTALSSNEPSAAADTSTEKKTVRFAEPIAVTKTISPDNDNTPKPSITPGFTLGLASIVDTTPTFPMFGLSKTEKTSETPSSSSDVQTTTATVSSLSFGTNTTTVSSSGTPFKFGLTSSSIATPSFPKISSTSGEDKPSDIQTVSTSSLFGTSNTTSASTKTTSSFNFGVKSSTTTAPVPIFPTLGQSTAELKVEKPSSTTDVPTTTTMPLFGSSNTQNSSLAAPLFNFGAKPSTTSNFQPSFGPKSDDVKIEKPTNTANVPPTAAAAPIFAFGSQTNQATSNASIAPINSGTVNNFSLPSTTGIFQFGQSSTTGSAVSDAPTTNPPLSFNFAQTTTANSTSNNDLFKFGNNNSSTVSSTGSATNMFSVSTSGPPRKIAMARRRGSRR